MRINDTLQRDRGNGGIDRIAAGAQDLDRSERDSGMRGRGHAPVADRQRAPGTMKSRCPQLMQFSGCWAVLVMRRSGRFIAKNNDVVVQAERRGRTRRCDRTLDRGGDRGRLLRPLGDKEDAPSLQDCRDAHGDRTFGNRRRIGKIDGISRCGLLRRA